MCDEDMPAVFQYFTKVSSLPSLPVLPSFSLVLLPLFDASVCPQEALCDEDAGGLDPKDPNRPRFTLQELRDVLHERNELKAKVFLLQEELAYYKRCSHTSKLTRFNSKLLIIMTVCFCSEETEDEMVTPSPSPSPDLRTRSRSAAQPESGIKRLYVALARFHLLLLLLLRHTCSLPAVTLRFKSVTQITLHALSDYNEPCMLKHLHITLQDTCKLNLCSSLSDNILLPLRVHT